MNMALMRSGAKAPLPLTPPHKGEGDSATLTTPLPLVGRGKGWG